MLIEKLEKERDKKRKELDEIEKEILFWKIVNEQNKIKRIVVKTNLIKVFDLLYLSQIWIYRNKSDDGLHYFLNLAGQEVKDNIDFLWEVDKLIGLYYDYAKYISNEEDYEIAKKIHSSSQFSSSIYRPKL